MQPLNYINSRFITAATDNINLIMPYFMTGKKFFFCNLSIHDLL